jgi:hypothetical protein
MACCIVNIFVMAAHLEEYEIFRREREGRGRGGGGGGKGRGRGRYPSRYLLLCESQAYF